MWNNNNIPRYQAGSYIPGLSSQMFGAGLRRDTASAQEDLRGKAKSLGKKEGWGRLGSWLGSKGGKWLGSALSAGFAATNPLYALAVKAGGAGLGSYLGSKLGRGDDVSLTNKYGLLGSQYEDIGKYQKGMGEAAKGAAWGDVAQTFGQGLTSEYGKQLWDTKFTSEGKEKWFGEKLGSKSFDELSKMKFSDMLGESRTGARVEEGLGKFGKDVFTRREEPYGGASYPGQSLEDIDISGWRSDAYRQQEGGAVGMQEGGSPEDSYKIDPDFDYLYANEDMDWTGKDEKWYKDWIDLVAKKNPKFLKEKDEPYDRWEFFNMYNKATEGGEFPPDSLFNVYNPDFISPNPMFHPDTLDKRRLEREETLRMFEENPEQFRDVGKYQYGGMAYPLQMAGGGYMPEQGYGGLIQHRKGY